MKPLAELVERIRKNHKLLEYGEDGLICSLHIDKSIVFVIASNGMGWDHISVRPACNNRVPTLGEMCAVKDFFFYPEECALLLLPPKSRYVNCHPHVLHLWRPQNINIPQPPLEMV